MKIDGTRKTDTREMLIEEYFTHTGYDIASINKFTRRLKTYLSSNEPDREIEYILLATQIDRESYVSNDFEVCKKMATPIFKELVESGTALSFVDISVLARVVEFAPTFDLAEDSTEKILHLLDTDHSHEKKYKTAKFITSFNVIPRLIRAKYPSANASKTEGSLDEIQTMFNHHLEISKAVAEKNNLTSHLAMLQLREGVFFASADLVEKGVVWLKTHDRKGWYSSAVDELLTYYSHLRADITKTQLDILVGYRISKKRESQSMPSQYAAEFLGITDATLKQIETGRRGAKSIHLYKLSYLFNVDVSYFLYGETTSAQGNDEELETVLQEIRLHLKSAPSGFRSQVSGIVKTLAKSLSNLFD